MHWNDSEVAFVKDKCKICSEVPKATFMLWDGDDVVTENISFNVDQGVMRNADSLEGHSTLCSHLTYVTI